MLARATGAKIVNKISDLQLEDLGYSGLVEERKVGEEEVVYVTECQNPKAVTVLLRGGTEHVVDEIERAKLQKKEITVETQFTHCIFNIYLCFL